MSLTTSNNRLIVAVKKKILIFARDETGASWTFDTHEIDQSAPVLPQKPRKYLPDTEDEESSENKVQELEFQTNNIAASPTSNLVSVSTTDKTLYLFKLSDKALSFLSRRKIARNTSCLRFGSDDVLFVTDKTGDVFTFNCSNPEEPGQWILGHLSQVLDVAVDDNFVVTCDRDEKIKISHYPNAYEIEAFCMGHEEFVSSIVLVSLSGTNSSKKILISGSGDSTIRFWEYPSGRQVHKVATDSPVGSLVTVEDDNKIIIAALLRRPDQIQLFEVTVTNEGKIQCKKFGNETIIENSFIISMTFALSELQVLVFNESDGLQLISTGLDGKERIYNIPQEVFKLKELKFEDSLENLYKKKFDNVAAYQERKRRRIEQEQKAKSIKS